jgi:hypothetical protein
MRLAFSLPVHENNEVVANLIENIFHYNPQSIVVLHISQIFTDFNEQMFREMPNVFVNPRRYLTQHGKGMLLTHCSNFRYLQALNAGFDVFCISSSNEMFIRPGLVDYVKEVKNAFQAVRFDPKLDWHVFVRRIDQHPKVQLLLAALGTSEVYGGQTEGQFFEKAIFQQIADFYFSAFGETEINDFETEEIVPQTVAMAMKVRPALPFTLVDYSNYWDFSLSVPVLKKLADPLLVGRVKLNLGQKGSRMLVSPHLNTDNRSVFAVKRIPRKLDDPLRVFINQLSLGNSIGAKESSRQEFSNSFVPLIPNLRWKQIKRVSGLLMQGRSSLGIKPKLKKFFRSLIPPRV